MPTKHTLRYILDRTSDGETFIGIHQHAEGHLTAYTFKNIKDSLCYYDTYNHVWLDVDRDDTFTNADCSTSLWYILTTPAPEPVEWTK